MGWHEAYLAQARSDYAILKRLDAPEVECCHRLHYLQMVTEKLAKAMLTPPRCAEPAPMTHTAFVRMLQVLKIRPEIRRQLGFRDAKVFKNYVDSLLDAAAKIEHLSPDQAGLTRPNPEYPWQTQPGGEVQSPADYAFAEFGPRDPRMIKIDRLLNTLLRIVS